MAVLVATRNLVVKLQLNPAWAFMTMRTLKARLTQSRVWGSQVKWVSSVTPLIGGGGVLSHLTTSSPIRTWEWSQDWWVSEVNRVTLDFWASIANCFLSAHLTRVEPNRFALASACTMLRAEASNGKVVSVWRHANICDGAVRHQVVEEGWVDYGTLWHPHPHLLGRRMVLVVRLCRIRERWIISIRIQCETVSNSWYSDASLGETSDIVPDTLMREETVFPLSSICLI